ncbi:DUF7144 family membrane protein [Streptomyces lunaelactis]|uniref:DUF7144 family membrane protein n=1 Tax=Streptomyces lunaelactis TaxID=1535768 RepID=UPI00403935A3
MGIVIVLAGFALFKGAAWARIVGVVLVGLSMIANFMWVPYAPFWALALIAIDVFAIIETGTDSYRLASTRARAEETAKAGCPPEARLDGPPQGSPGRQNSRPGPA